MQREVTTFSQAAVVPSAGRPWPLAAVFDCDGLLVDTAHCWHAAYAAVAADGGHELDTADLGSLNGASVDHAAEHLGLVLDLPISRERLRAELERTVAAMPLEPMAGAARLLAEIGRELPLAVASNGPAVVVDVALRRTGLRHHFSAIVSAEQVAAPKPWPDVYLEACRQLGVDPSDAIALEDSPLGARAARAAGLLLIAVPADRAYPIEADLAVTRLDDPRVLGLFGLPGRPGP